MNVVFSPVVLLSLSVPFTTWWPTGHSVASLLFLILTEKDLGFVGIFFSPCPCKSLLKFNWDLSYRINVTESMNPSVLYISKTVSKGYLLAPNNLPYLVV